MEITHDIAKDAANRKKHGISLDQAQHLNLDTATVVQDIRKDYGEMRYIATGLSGQRLHVMIFTPRNSSIRVISLRKANKKEREKYEKET